jgi:hypothetical protein
MTFCGIPARIGLFEWRCCHRRHSKCVDMRCHPLPEFAAVLRPRARPLAPAVRRGCDARLAAEPRRRRARPRRYCHCGRRKQRRSRPSKALNSGAWSPARFANAARRTAGPQLRREQAIAVRATRRVEERLHLRRRTSKHRSPRAQAQKRRLVSEGSEAESQPNGSTFPPVGGPAPSYTSFEWR